jgi:hypothetical protein
MRINALIVLVVVSAFAANAQYSPTWGSLEDFGSRTEGSIASKSYTLKYTGSGTRTVTLTAGNINPALPNFISVSPATFTISQNQTKTITLTIAFRADAASPKFNGQLFGTVIFKDDQAVYAGLPSFTVSGTVLPAASPMLQVNPTDIDLGSGESGAGFSRTYVVTNTGGEY